MAKYTLSNTIQHNGFLDHIAVMDTNMLTRLIVETDPATGRRSAVLFSDDGLGNGLPLFHFLILNPDVTTNESDFYTE